MATDEATAGDASEWKRVGFDVPLETAHSRDRDLAAIASTTGGQAFEADSASALRAVYADIGQAVGFRPERREVSQDTWIISMALATAFAGAAGNPPVVLAVALIGIEPHEVLCRNHPGPNQHCETLRLLSGSPQVEHSYLSHTARPQPQDRGSERPSKEIYPR